VAIRAAWQAPRLLGGRAVTAGHAGNDSVCAQAVAQNSADKIDRAMVEFRARFVHQVTSFQAVGPGGA